MALGRVVSGGLVPHSNIFSRHASGAGLLIGTFNLRAGDAETIAQLDGDVMLTMLIEAMHVLNMDSRPTALYLLLR